MNVGRIPDLIQHGITTNQPEPSFKEFFRVLLIIVVLVSVVIPVLIFVIRRLKQTR